jgi:hypothetical protein
MRTIHAVLILAAVTLVACSKKQEAAQAPAADASGNMAGMQMGPGMQGMQMMSMMRAHLDSIGAMQPAQMATMMAAHQGLASHMMDAMGADMRSRNMTPDAAWTALGDSLRQDLADLPGLTGAALTTRMQAHIGRMQRMMTLHEGMMKM